MAIPINEKPVDDAGETCTAGDTQCNAPERQPQAQQQPQEEQTATVGEEEAGTEGIRTIAIPIPAGTGSSSRPPTARPAASSDSAPLSGRPAPPALNSLVRFLRNPEGAMRTNDSAYLGTMYSTDQADLVLRSALNASGYY